ncbi:Rid family detoxifying hydrolase [Silvimonas amylolytica]|jgi:reactive intermediate/imine deaminase|uniref:Reactive intermediate/imine deaminase n=1 Tax=Silvimonas amylolytica TaxID=449663 RepID=A0ABQ2PRM6_9NEIS|nr:Rid family detoxifying hydrolase [Silvimonas amylolytica]GGP28264.1 reactive intermediate/imine deaminase [Silvimonas amylolytica]
MSKSIIHSDKAPKAVGPYSQAVKVGDTVYLSGQIGLDPVSGNLVDGFDAQAHQVFTNLRAVAQAAGGDLSDIVKLGVFVTDLSNFARLNEIMTEYFVEPYPARAAIQAAALPKGAIVEADAVLVLSK